jgi:hypothetical protein
MAHPPSEVRRMSFTMNPRPAEGETRAEFEARWKAVSDELAVFTQETKRMAEEMTALPWWRLIRLSKMLNEVQRRNKVAHEWIAVAYEMGDHYKAHKWPKQPVQLH